jgi:ribonuclease P protein component
LSTAQRYTLGKTERLKSRKAIEQLFEKGQAFSLFPLRVIYMLEKKEEEKKEDLLQCGFSVSAKRFKKATDRNRIKRVLRETWRLQKKELQAAIAEQNMQLNVFLIYTGNELPQYEKLITKTAAAIKRLIKTVDENSKAGT